MKVLSGWGRVGAQAFAVGMMSFLAACGGGGSEGEDIGTASGESVVLDARESALSVSRRASTPVYHVTDLGTLGGARSEAAAINDRGQVTGNAVSATGATRAFLYNGNGMVDLGVVPRPGNQPDEFPRNSIGLGINNRGQVVGWSDTNNSGAVHAFLYSGGTMEAPPSMPAQVAFDINDRGQVVGVFAGFTDQAFLWDDGVYQVLGNLPGGEFADAMAINGRGQIAGDATLPRPASTRIDRHAFLYSGGKMRDLGTLGGNVSHGFDVNLAGWVVGESTLAGDATGHAFLHDGRRMRDLGSLGGDDASASGVNDAGQVVGSSFTAGRTNQHAFVWNDGVMYDLNGLLDDSGSDWTLLTAADINNRGQIVGTGLVNGLTHAFLLTPVERGHHRGRWSGKEGHVPEHASGGRSSCSDALAALLPHKCKAH